MHNNDFTTSHTHGTDHNAAGWDKIDDSCKQNDNGFVDLQEKDSLSVKGGDTRVDTPPPFKVSSTPWVDAGQLGKAISEHFPAVSFIVIVAGYVIINSFGTTMGIKEYFYYIIFLFIFFVVFEVQRRQGKASDKIQDLEKKKGKKNKKLYLIFKIVFYILLVLFTIFLLVLSKTWLLCSPDNCREIIDLL